MKQLKIYQRILNDGTVWVATTFQKDPDYIKIIQKGDTPSCSLVTLSDALGAGWQEIFPKGVEVKFVDGDLWEKGEEWPSDVKDFEVLEYGYRGRTYTKDEVSFSNTYTYTEIPVPNKVSFGDIRAVLGNYSIGSESPPADFKDRTITKVKRLSDGVIFSVGDTVGLPSNYSRERGVLTKFYIDDNCYLRGVGDYYNNGSLTNVSGFNSPLSDLRPTAQKEFDIKYQDVHMPTQEKSSDYYAYGFKNNDITNVKRISDGKVFKVGDKVLVPFAGNDNVEMTIESFTTKDYLSLFVKFKEHNYDTDVNSLAYMHPAPPNETPTQKKTLEATLRHKVEQLEQKLKEREDQLEWLIEQIDKIKTTKGNTDASIH